MKKAMIFGSIVITCLLILVVGVNDEYVTEPQVPIVTRADQEDESTTKALLTPSGKFELRTEPDTRRTSYARTGDADASEQQASTHQIDEGWFLCEIVDEQGTPLSGAELALTDCEFAECSGISDISGHCELRRTNLGTADQAVRAYSAGRLAVTARLRSGVSHLKIVLPTSTNVFGSVVDNASGSPIPEATVILMSWSLDPEDSLVRTDQLGQFGPLTVPSEDIFSLMVIAKGYSDHVERCTPLPNSWGLPHKIEIGLESSMDVRLSLFDSESGLPVSGAMLTPGWAFGRSWTTDDSGIVTLNDAVPSGNGVAAYDLRASGYCLAKVRLTRDLVKASPVIEVPLIPEARLLLLTQDETGAPVCGLELYIEYERLHEGHHAVLVRPGTPPWPDHLSWVNESLLRPRLVLSDDSGQITIGNIPPGLIGFRIRIKDNAQRPPILVEEFAIPGRTKTVIVKQ